MKISVVIPVKNGAQTLDKCLCSIKSQTVEDLEIIILDSMSTDGSREIALNYGAILIDIPNGTFDHGLTRNKGIQYAKGDFVFLTVQDSWFSEKHMLEKMATHFQDEKVMAVTGHQAVPPGKETNPLFWFKRYSEPLVKIREVKDIDLFKNTDFNAKRSLIAWDDVVSMYRKSAIIELLFVKTDFAEDWVWSRDALEKGWRLIYDPSILVYHYHHSGYHFSYIVSFTINYHFYKFFSNKPVIPKLLQPMAIATYHLIKNPHLDIKEKLYWIFHNYSISLGYFNSHLNFLFQDLIGGIKSIEKRYRKVCNIIPQGKQKL